MGWVARRADRRAWADAADLEDAGELMAGWLEGRSSWRPGYCADRPDPETDELVDVLAALNRAGYLTTDSQPGLVEGGYRQRASVCGFAHEDVAGRIVSAADNAGLVVHCWETKRRLFGGWRDRRTGIVVTEHEDEGPQTVFGGRIDRSWMGTMFGGVSRSAFEDIAGSWQVSVTDPVWGRDDVLWPVLVEAVDADVDA